MNERALKRSALFIESLRVTEVGHRVGSVSGAG